MTAEPFAARPDGLVPITVPFAMPLLCTGDTLAMVKPSAVSTAVAWVTESLATTGIEAYRPEVSHQPPSPSPMPSARTSATTTSRGLNSQRCRNGSRPPGYRPPSSRCTTSVREPSDRRLRPGQAGLERPGAGAVRGRRGVVVTPPLAGAGLAGHGRGPGTASPPPVGGGGRVQVEPGRFGQALDADPHHAGEPARLADALPDPADRARELAGVSRAQRGIPAGGRQHELVDRRRYSGHQRGGSRDIGLTCW